MKIRVNYNYIRKIMYVMWWWIGWWDKDNNPAMSRCALLCTLLSKWSNFFAIKFFFCLTIYHCVFVWFWAVLFGGIRSNAIVVQSVKKQKNPSHREYTRILIHSSFCAPYWWIKKKSRLVHLPIVILLQLYFRIFFFTKLSFFPFHILMLLL